MTRLQGSGRGAGRFWGLLVAILLLLAGCGREPSQSEVWIVGWDCADWDQLKPMLARGELPHLAGLLQDGASGVLRSDNPMISPILWTSIATGKSPDLHGITWFMTDAPDGTKVPISSHERRVRAIWDITSEAGLSNGIVGWWATWPADPVQGWLVSDYVAWHSFGVSGKDATSAGKTWPPELMAEVEKLLPRALEQADRLLPRLVHLSDREIASRLGAGGDPYGDHLAHLRQSVATTQVYTDLVLEQLDHDRPRLLGVYYEGTDAMSHLFGDFAPPKLPWVSDSDFTAFKDVVDEYWRWQDELLGELLAKRGPLTTVIILSDHGFRYGDERRKEEQFQVDTADKDHMPDGMIVLSGPDIRAGATIEGADIYDLAPTVLHLLGLPAAEDMTGAVIASALRPEALAERPVRLVPTYETSPRQRGQVMARDEQAARSMDKMLRSLGYVVGDGDQTSAAEDRAAAGEYTAEQVVNLAEVLMAQGRAGEAVTELEAALAEHPGDFMIRLNLAQALARSGQEQRAEATYRDLLREFPQQLDVYEDLAMLLGLEGRHADALAVYDQGLAQAPDWIPGLAGRGNALFQLGRVPEARQALQAALSRDPSNHEAHFYLGALEAETGDLAGAETTLRRAHELEPGHKGTALKLAAVLEQQGKPQQAVAVLQRTLVNAGQDGQLLGEIGGIQLRGGQNSAALVSLQRAHELAPQDAFILGNLGMAEAVNGNLPAALADFERVVALDPALAGARAQLGALYSQAGRLEEADRELTEAVRLEPGNAMFQYNLGMIRSRRGDLEAGRRALREAIRLDDRFAAAYFNLGRLELSAGNQQEGQRLIDRARELDPRLTQR